MILKVKHGLIKILVLTLLDMDIYMDSDSRFPYDNNDYVSIVIKNIPTQLFFIEN